jgi:hypothetical protein
MFFETLHTIQRARIELTNTCVGQYIDPVNLFLGDRDRQHERCAAVTSHAEVVFREEHPVSADERKITAVDAENNVKGSKRDAL